MNYKAAGVDIAAGDRFSKRVGQLARETFSPAVLLGIGHFGAFYELDLDQYEKPVLVSSVDGVGTKLKIAFEMGKYDTIGEDLVNHCVNDIMAGAAKPLYFLDYYGTGKLDNAVAERVMQGLVRGCKNAGCALIGGETAEMPGFYQPGEFDIVGLIVGIVERDKIINGSSIEKGDILIGLPSDGLHTNGFSLARKVLFEIKKFQLDQKYSEMELPLGEELLRVHRSYQKEIDAMKNMPFLRGMSHITGGGILGNTKRILPPNRKLMIHWGNWERPPIFKLIQHCGSVKESEMRSAFNLGVGFIFVVDRNFVGDALAILNELEESVFIVGEVT
ncbi:phosphoribosylformylglycinamidine cyclo-ligase [candidate division KSB1 bacterium]|nr:phosphoribosylformylglycinamidine cyclo-ligase [candidate division KSB1 bacterium]